MRMPWEDDIDWGNTATTIVKGEPMSILIKGMNMPISCEKCPLCYDYLHCSIDDSLHMFLYNRHPNCPLIEIPTPHGRLIEEHYPGELQAKQPEGLFIMYRSADKDTDRFILEAEE